MQLVSDDALVLLKKNLAAITKAWTAGVCMGGTYSLDGKALGAGHSACHSWVYGAFGWHCFPNQAMYGGWRDLKYGPKSKDFIVGTCHKSDHARVKCGAEASDFLVRWMANDSPFSKFILNRDDDESITKAGLLILCGPNGATVSEAMWICKVLRFTTEGAQAANTFMALVKGGVNGQLAVLVASFVREYKGAAFGFTDVEQHSTVFNTYNGEADPVGLLLGNVDRNADSTTSVFVTPKDFKFAKKDNKALQAPKTKIQGFCKPVKKSDGWGGTVQGVGADEATFVAAVLAWQAELEAMVDGAPAPEPVVKKPPLPTSKTVYLELDM